VRRSLGALCLVFACLVPEGNARAGGEQPSGGVTVTPSGGGPIVKLGIHQAAHGRGGVGSGDPTCVWTMLSGPGPSTTSYDPYRDASGIMWQYWSKACASGTTFHLIPVLPPGVAMPEWRDDLVKMIPATEPVWSPLMPTQYVSYPTYVWLDKANTADVTLEVRIPSTSATMTARATKVVFNPGIAADAVTCAGIPSKREDCSYTYRRTSKDEENMRYQASVSVTWAISWTATSGESGTLASYTATTDLPIAVAKIQIVGA
jgi:hypothetical protein